MPENNLKEYWNPSFDLLYDACFYELSSDYIIQVWYWIDLALSMVTAMTALAAAVAGLVLWGNPSGKILWGYLSIAAFGLIIVHGFISIPSRIRKEGERRQVFFSLRVEIRTFRAGLPRASDAAMAGKRFGILQKRLLDCISTTPADIVFTHASRRSVQAMVNKKLEMFISG